MFRKLHPQIAVVSAAFLGTGCVGMHSIATGHPASLPGPGRGEVALSPGLTYERISSTGGSNPVTTLLGFPTLEGNVSYGLGESVGLNLHLSTGGFQPGIHVVLVNGPLCLAVLPEVAFAYGRETDSTSSPSSESTWDGIGFLAGTKVLVSHASGIYASAGYDYQYTKFTSHSGADSSPGSSSSQKVHNITAGLGYTIHAASISIRPEIAFLYAPSATTSASDTSSTVKSSGWAIMPTLSFAATAGH
jgi:hypothetical protein